MIVTANTNFAGVYSMVEGEQRDIPEGSVLSDLLRAGYVSSVETVKEVKTDENKRNNSGKRKTVSKD